MKAAFNLAKSCTEEITWKRGYPPGQDAPGQYSAVSRKLQGLALSVSTFHTAFLLCDLVLKGVRMGICVHNFTLETPRAKAKIGLDTKKRARLLVISRLTREKRPEE